MWRCRSIMCEISNEQNSSLLVLFLTVNKLLNINFLCPVSPLANSVDPDQMATEGGVCSGFALFGVSMQTGQTLIRGLLKEPYGLGLHCLHKTCKGDAGHKWVNIKMHIDFDFPISCTSLQM